MATKTIAWESGGGYITLTYTGVGNGPISVQSDTNELFEDRQQTVQIVTTDGSPQKAVNLLVKQKGKTYPAGTVFNFAYTGSVQEITLPKGRYKLQCWGAQGGNVSGSYTATGSKGGYSEGVLTLTEPTTIYVFVGGQGTSSSTSSTSGTANGGWNGGGSSVRYSSYNSGDTYGESYPRPGGGATDMCLVTSTMNYSSGRTVRSSESLLSRFIVAGGGAGASARYTEITSTSTVVVDTLFGSFSSYVYQSSSGNWIYTNNQSNIPQSQTFFKKGVKYRVNGSFPNGFVTMQLYYDSYSASSLINLKTIGQEFTVPNTFGGKVLLHIAFREQLSDISLLDSIRIEELSDETSTSTSSDKSNSSQQGGGTSGRGQYPGTQSSAGSGGAFGLGANQTNTNYRYDAGAGGGGWYGGGTSHSDTGTSYVNYSGGGSGFVNTAANAGYRPSGYTSLQLDSGTTTAGNSSHPSTSGGTETGHSGNGYARITVLE